MIYLDYAATTPMRDPVLEVYLNVARNYYGNPGSLHDIGSDAKQILEASRNTMAKILNAQPGEIYFTGGGTEANQRAIKALISSAGKKEGHLITTSTEHSSVRYLFDKLEGDGFGVTRLPVSEEGLVSLEELESSIREDTIMASIQHVNSETGVIQDVQRIGKLLRSKGVLFHSDCVQSFCKVDVQAPWFDAVSVSGHKIYGPKGVGAVYLSDKVAWKPEVPETKQEGGLQGGTPDVAAIAALATAAKLLFAERTEEFIRFTDQRQRLLDGLRAGGHEVIDEGSQDSKLPNILGLRFPGMEGQYLMLECSQAGVGISTGSACQAGSDQPNHTMLAMGRSEEQAREFVRLSLGKGIGQQELEQIIQKIDAILSRHFKKITS